MDPRAKPVRVSPIIKGARWSFLLLGIFMGISKRSTYFCREARQKPIREKRLRENEAKLKVISKKVYKDLLIDMAKIFGVDLPPNFDPD